MSEKKGWVEYECVVELALSLRYIEGTEGGVLSGFDSYDKKGTSVVLTIFNSYYCFEREFLGCLDSF